MNRLQREAGALQSFLGARPRIVVLTGAGVSVSSGIPTYRDRDGVWRGSEPIKHQEFLLDDDKRRRYWARSAVGWPVVRDARPGPAHAALASLERSGRLELLITQNVDGLHQRAGSEQVVDLHGRLDRVRCLQCAAIHRREDIQTQLQADNAYLGDPGFNTRPDGDADVSDALVNRMKIPTCPQCTGQLKPDVVFFGGTVPHAIVAQCMAAVEKADALLAIGSSLQVYSGFRFCKRAAQLGKPIAIVNPGKTRADNLASLRINSDCGALLQRVSAEIVSARRD